MLALIAELDTEALDEVLKYKHPGLIARMMRELNISEAEAIVLFADLKKFLFLCANHEPPHCPPPKIDEAWHTFLLHTKNYDSFCWQFFGKFIHHVPTPLDAPHNDGCGGKRTVVVAKEVFGEPLSENWSRAAYAKDTHDSCSCDDCGDCGSMNS